METRESAGCVCVWRKCRWWGVCVVERYRGVVGGGGKVWVGWGGGVMVWESLNDCGVWGIMMMVMEK